MAFRCAVPTSFPRESVEPDRAGGLTWAGHVSNVTWNHTVAGQRRTWTGFAIMPWRHPDLYSIVGVLYARKDIPSMQSLADILHSLYNTVMGGPVDPINQQTEGKLTRLTAWLPLLWLSLSFMTGILVAHQLHLARAFWLDLVQNVLPADFHNFRIIWIYLAGIVFVLAIVVRILFGRLRFKPFNLPAPTLFILSLSLVTFFLGAARYHATIPFVDAHYISWYNDREYEVLVTGTVTDPPDTRDTYTNLRLEVTDVDTGDGNLPVDGLILARVPPGGDWHYGDVLRLRGHLKTPPENEGFSYLDYLAHQGIHAYMADGVATRLPFTGGTPLLHLIYTFKEMAVEQIYRLFSDPEASLLAGILLGDDNGLPADLQQAYQNTGTAHIIAISGFNITIIASLLVSLFSRLFGPRKGAFAAVAGIAMYTILVGATPSVLRAAIMGGLAILARQLGRRQNGLNTLAFTAAVMAAIDPNTLWDVGFQLSFAATLGLILYAQPLQDWFTALLARRISLETARRICTPISTFMFFTLAAQLTTLPIMAWHFGRISLVSVIANPFVLPAQPALMILAGLALLFSFIYFPLGQVIAWLAWPFAAYTDRTVEFFNRLPHGVITLGDFSFLLVIVFYVLLLSLTFAGIRLRQTLRLAVIPSVILTVLGVSAFLTWSAASSAPDGRLHLTFLNVGTADAILIQTPSGRSLLVDGGPSPSTLSSALGVRLPAFDRLIDWLVIASPQEQQVAALPRVLDRFPPQNVLWAGNIEASWSAGELDRWLAANRIPVTPAYPGAALDLGEGARLEVLSLSPRGAVLLVEWQGFRALLPVGMNLDTLLELENGKKIGPVTALLLADSGLAQLNPPEWIANLQPQLVILSVAAGDQNGLPDPTVLEGLAGSSLLRTDRKGWIEISTDGQKMWVEVERK
jgi:competence protein ComEC